MLWDGTYGFSPLSKKTSKTNRLHDVITKATLSSDLKTLGVGPAWDRFRDLPLRRPTLSQLSQPGGGSSALASSLFYASVNSSCAQPPSPPPPPPTPLMLIPGITIFFCLGWQIPGVGDPWAVKSLGVGRKKGANAPSSVKTATFFIDRTVE